MEHIKTTSLQALRLVFRPIARILLRAGISWKEIVEVIKATYVEVASEDFGIRGRQTNISRVSILTGFSRREVRRLRDLLDEEKPVSFERHNAATRVLTAWYSDDDYTEGDGLPRPLLAAGENPSFETLCSRFASDVPATTMLKELRHVGAVDEGEDGRLIAKTRYYMPVLMDPEQMLRSGSVLQDIGTTVAYNLHREKDQPTRFERFAFNDRVPVSAVPAFREFVEKEGQAFLERVDAWLTQQEDTEAKDVVRLGLGAYWIENTLEERAES